MRFIIPHGTYHAYYISPAAKEKPRLASNNRRGDVLLQIKGTAAYRQRPFLCLFYCACAPSSSLTHIPGAIPAAHDRKYSFISFYFLIDKERYLHYNNADKIRIT